MAPDAEGDARRPPATKPTDHVRGWGEKLIEGSQFRAWLKKGSNTRESLKRPNTYGPKPTVQQGFDNLAPAYTAIEPDRQKDEAERFVEWVLR